MRCTFSRETRASGELAILDWKRSCNWRARVVLPDEGKPEMRTSWQRQCRGTQRGHTCDGRLSGGSRAWWWWCCARRTSKSGGARGSAKTACEMCPSRRQPRLETALAPQPRRRPVALPHWPPPSTGDEMGRNGTKLQGRPYSVSVAFCSRGSRFHAPALCPLPSALCCLTSACSCTRRSCTSAGCCCCCSSS
jgi:hypothetical protein